MKPIFLLLFLLPSMVLAQSFNYEIKGNIKNYQPNQKVYLVHDPNLRRIDSVVVSNGTFSFKGKTEVEIEPDENLIQSRAWLFIMHNGKSINFRTANANVTEINDVMNVYFEPGLTEIDMADSARNAIITPPIINAGHYSFDSINAAFSNKQHKAAIEVQKYTDAKLRTAWYDQKNNVLKAEQKKDLWQFVKDHLSSPVSLYVLKHVEDFYPDYDRLASYFDPLAAPLKKTTFGKAYAGMLENLKKTRMGAVAPAFKMDNTQGKTVALSSFKGKYVLIDFWASWCGPCRRENPSVVKAFNQYKNQNFTILGVSLDQEKKDWVKAIADDHLDWTQISDLRYWDTPAAKLYSVTAIPQNFLIDPDGKIIGKNLFGADLTKKLAQLFSVTGTQ